MMSFEERERGFEAKFVHDETMRFRAEARRDKLFADWATQHYGLSPADAERLHHAVLAVPGGPGHDVAVVSLVHDLAPAPTQPAADPAIVLAELAIEAMQPSKDDHSSPFDA